MAASTEPRGQRREFTDAELRADSAAGLKPREIAAKYGVSRQAVYKRLAALHLSTTAAAVAPQESTRFVARTIDALEELVDSLACVQLLRDACDRWLRDAKDPARYDIGARASEIDVTYSTLEPSGDSYRTVRHKEPLQTLLNRVAEKLPGAPDLDRSESKFSDPRELILATCAEARQIVTTAAALAKFLAEARRMEEFREELLAAIAEASPETRDAIVERLRARLVLHAAFRGPGALPGG